jgi:hypothetical protein
MSVSSMAQDSAIRLGNRTSSLQDMVTSAASAAAIAAKGPDSVEAATSLGVSAAKKEIAEAAPVPSSPLSELVKYIPTETLTIYIAVQAAIGDPEIPSGGDISDADYSANWIGVWVLLVANLGLTIGLSYRAQRNANTNNFKIPVFEAFASEAAFLVWVMSLPSTPLRDFPGFDYSAWNSVLILVGSITIVTLAYILGKNVTWQKVPGTGIE